MIAFFGSSKTATRHTTAAPIVAPTMGIRPRKPTATASTAAYGIPTIIIMIHEQTALIVATATWPMA